MSNGNNYYYDDYNMGDRAADAGIYDEFEGASTGSRRASSDGKTRKKKKYRRVKKDKAGSGRSGKSQKPVDKKKRRLRTALIVLLCLALLAVCGVVLAKQFVKEKFEQVDRVEVNEEDWGIDPRVKEELKDYKNIVLLGVDTREGDGETDESGVRSDAIIIVTINKKTNEITLTSVLRDSYLDLEEKGSHVIDKVTHAHAFGGPVNTVRALNRNLDLNIDDYVRVDWRSVAEITDAMGGLEVTVDDHELDELNRIIDHTNQSLHMDNTYVDNTGKQVLNGVQIVAYCRIRKTDGDDERAERMREVIKAAMDKAKTMKLSELNNLLNLGMKKISTSMSSDTMMDLVGKISKFGNMGSQRWPFNYDGAYINSVWYDAPITLKSNVVELHEKLFGQVDYQPTDNVLMINEEVKMETQYYGEEDVDYELLDRYLNTFGGGPNAGQSRNSGNPGNTDYDTDYDSNYYNDQSDYDDGSYTAPASDDSGGEDYTEPADNSGGEDYTEPVDNSGGGDSGGGDGSGGDGGGGDSGGGDSGGEGGGE